MLGNEHFRTLVDWRKNQTLEWYSTDQEKDYKEIHRGQPNLYKPGDFSYSFNSDGFRCDSFDLPSDFPILFNGCSHTEGVGLPIEHVWSYLLLEKIREKLNVTIPYWNIGLSGAGFETMTEAMMWFAKRSPSKPRLVISLFPLIYRREWCWESFDVRRWFSSDMCPLTYANLVFSDKDFAVHQCYRSMQTMEALRMHFNATCFYSTWDDKEGWDSLTNLRDSHRVPFPPLHVFNTTWARDSNHYGPDMHQKIADRFWKVIEPWLNSL